MLKKWIEEVRAQSDRYRTNYWKYHISGNVVELSILPAYMKEKKTYRCSVIGIGQVLKKLAHNIEEQQSYFHIQSFPSLENPEVVASIRMDESSLFSRQHSQKNSLAETNHQNLFSAFQSLANQYQLALEELSDVNEELIVDINMDKYPEWFALYSSFDNPFTWLNIGYWKEAILHISSDEELQEPLFKTIDFCVHDKYEKSPDKSRPKKYLQALIGLQEVKVDYK